MSYALTRYQKYLKSYYSNYPMSRDDKLSIAPCTQFINLALVQKTEEEAKLDATTSGRDEVVVSNSPLEIDALVVPDF